MKRLVGKIFMVAGILAISGGSGFGLPPPRPGLVDPYTQRFRISGLKVPVIPWEVRTYRRATTLNGKFPLDPTRAPARAGVRPLAVDTTTQSGVRPLVLLIDFADRPASSSPAISNPAAFDALFFGSGATDQSVRNYWNEVSYGKFTIQRPSAVSSNPDVVGWLRAGGTAPAGFPTTIASSSQVAGVQVSNVRQLLSDAIASLSSRGFNFTPYVRPSDGTFNMVIIVQPGAGQEDSRLSGDAYSHTAPIAPISTAAGTIVDYTIVPAKQYYSDPTAANPVTGVDPDLTDDPLVGVGVIVHEMGHLLGLPDLYPTSTFGQVGGNFTGVGVFDLMGYGLWGSNFLDRADNPAHISAWSKSFLGWLQPLLAQSTATRRLPPVEGQAAADKIFSNTDRDPTQYFLVENRQIPGAGDTWIFDRFLTAPTGNGVGALVWQIDEAVINANLAANTVNDDPQFRGVYVKEADGVYHFAQAVGGGTPNDLAKFFGLREDYFLSSTQLFDRTSPSATVNSSPIVDASHPVDYGAQVSLFGFTLTPERTLEYILSFAGGVLAPPWKTFNEASTAPPALPAGNQMRSDDILSLAFDSVNAVWMGSRDQGIFRFKGDGFDFLTTSQGLPGPGPSSPAGATVAPIQVMAFEAAAGSMWVGTDSGLFKMRDTGSGTFRVVSSFTTASPPPATLPGSNIVQAVAVRRGSDLKYAGTPVGFVRIVDGLTDAPADDAATVVLTGNVTAIAIDDNGNDDIRDDIVWVGFANGTFVRSKLPSEGGPVNGDPVSPSDFRSPPYTLSPSAPITSLAVDRSGILWIGTAGQGIQAFDLGDQLTPPQPNLRNPYNFNGTGVSQETYLNFNRVADIDGATGSNNVTGITFEASTQAKPIAWIGQKSDSSHLGGVSRFNANLAFDNTLFTEQGRDNRLKAYRQVPPEDVETAFGRSGAVSSVAGDSSGNVWIGTTQPDPNGVVRFGVGGTLRLDSNNYVNVSATATVTLTFDQFNLSIDAKDSAFVRVKSTSDPGGFLMQIEETGPNTGVFQGGFGFTEGETDPLARLIRVKDKDVVTVSVEPPAGGIAPASATWKEVPPFQSGIFIKPLCFITTAAYGSPMAPEVVAFRAFRDRYLVGNPVSRAFVGFYYLASPPLARGIARSPLLRAATRFALVPAAEISSFAVSARPAERGAVVALFVILGAWLVIRGRRCGR